MTVALSWPARVEFGSGSTTDVEPGLVMDLFMMEDVGAQGDTVMFTAADETTTGCPEVVMHPAGPPARLLARAETAKPALTDVALVAPAAPTCLERVTAYELAVVLASGGEKVATLASTPQRATPAGPEVTEEMNAAAATRLTPASELSCELPWAATTFWRS